MCCHSRSLQLFSKGQRTAPVTTGYQESLHQAQDDINLVEHSPDGLFVLGCSPMYTFRWLGIRKTLAGLTFEAEKSHFSFLFVLLRLWWMTLIFLLLFYDSWGKKKKGLLLCKYYTHSFGLEGTSYKRNPGSFFFFVNSFISDRFWATLLLAPDLKLGFPEPWVGKMSHFTCVPISWYSTRLPPLQEKGTIESYIAGLEWESPSPWRKVRVFLWSSTQFTPVLG